MARERYPVRAITLSHQGGVFPTGRGNALEAVVTGSGAQIVAHLYRLATTATQGTEHLLITDNIDISCIAADTTSPPTSNASFVNLSAQSRSGAEAGINYYGDKVRFADNSSTGVPITRVDWDLVTAGTFVPDASVGTSTSVTGYYPCDPSSGADFAAGARSARPPYSAPALRPRRPTSPSRSAARTRTASPRTRLRRASSTLLRSRSGSRRSASSASTRPRAR